MHALPLHRLPIHEEIAALWCEILVDRPTMDVDAALQQAHATIADRLAEAAAWDLMVAAMQQATPAPIAPHAPAQTA